MEAVPKSDIKSFIKSDIRFDISIKQTTWIGHQDRKKKYLFVFWEKLRLDNFVSRSTDL